MKYNKLGNTDLEVSVICLGTMTYGHQNTEEEAHAQIDYALERGINFIDTAEMYPVPGKPETQGLTEEYIGSWFAKTGRRKEVILASKVTGKLPYFAYVHHGEALTRKRINDAIDLNLKRLQTDYLDLYQLHFPERQTNMFGKRGYNIHDTAWEDDFLGTIEGLDDLVKSGKIRYWGLSNETPWGVMHFRDIVNKTGMAGLPVSIQNPYSLLNRSFETGLAEIACREKIGLLAYSPLAFGRLSGKYHYKLDSERDRINKYHQLARYNGKNSILATEKYLAIAEENGISPTKMALAFVNTRDFLTSNIIGATTMEQLKENIDSIDLVLSDDVLKAIEIVHNLIPDPAP